MITGIVTGAGDPVVMLLVAGQLWRAIVDTGFNGGLELPDALRAHVQPRLVAIMTSILAGGQSILEEVFDVQFPFDGHVVPTEATFVAGNTILVGTGLLKDHRLEIDFPARTVMLQRVP
jgi:predicted aspartyl protease